MKKVCLILFVSMNCLILTACSNNKNSDKKNEETTATQDLQTKPDENVGKLEVDDEILRTTALSDLKDKTIVLTIQEDIDLAATGSSFGFENGEIVESLNLSWSKYPKMSFGCETEIRNGKLLEKGDSMTISFNSESGAGVSAGNGKLDFHGTSTFEILDKSKPLNKLLCRYRGEDPLFNTKLSDLDSAFGEWLQVSVLK